MSPEAPRGRRPVPRGLIDSLLYLVLVALPLGLAGLSGHLVRTHHARELALQEAGRMARSGLAMARYEGLEASLRTLEGTVGYEAAFYRSGERIMSTDPGFGPDRLDRATHPRPGPESGHVVLELRGRLGVLVAGGDMEAVTAASSPREPGPTYPGGLTAVGALALAVFFLGAGTLVRGSGASIPKAVLLAGVPLALAWGLLVGAAWKLSSDTERTVDRELGLAVALTRELGTETSPVRIASLTGLRVAKLHDGRLTGTSWDEPEPGVDLEGLPRPPLGRTAAGTLTTAASEEIRYAAYRGPAGTVVFLAPAPELPPREPGFRLLLLALGVTGAGVAFVVLFRGSSGA